MSMAFHSSGDRKRILITIFVALWLIGLGAALVWGS